MVLDDNGDQFHTVNRNPKTAVHDPTVLDHRGIITYCTIMSHCACYQLVITWKEENTFSWELWDTAVQHSTALFVFRGGAQSQGLVRVYFVFCLRSCYTSTCWYLNTYEVPSIWTAQKGDEPPICGLDAKTSNTRSNAVPAPHKFGVQHCEYRCYLVHVSGATVPCSSATPPHSIISPFGSRAFSTVGHGNSMLIRHTFARSR